MVSATFVMGVGAMVSLDWLNGVRLSLPRIRQRRASTRVETLEPRMVLATDFGDAPDTAAGSGAGNYETLLANNGPRHTIVAGLFLGAKVDGESDGVPNAKANGDDLGTDDEDGGVNPDVDLRVTAGTQPTITVRATNTTGTLATLSGWIDTNGDGTFDNATERAQIAVPTGTNGNLFTLTLPAIPVGFFGKTYARFRLSTDVAGGNATGLASDGEVEDYLVDVSLPGEGVVKAGGATRIASGVNGGPMVSAGSDFGSSVTRLGDIDGDGVSDLAVGAPSAPDGSSQGEVYILFANANGTIKSSTRLGSNLNGMPSLGANARFGSSMTSLGDMDGDGITDIAVGAPNESAGAGKFSIGAVYVLFLKSDGTVKTSTRISDNDGGGPVLESEDRFGSSVVSLGDITGDGITDLAVGQLGGLSNSSRTSVHILHLNPNGSVFAKTQITTNVNTGPNLVGDERLGSSLANLGDLDGDGNVDLAVGSAEGSTRGSVFVLFLRNSGSVRSTTRIASGIGGGPTIPDLDRFGSSMASVGDLDGDGVRDLAVGALAKSLDGFVTKEAVYVLLMNRDGRVKASYKIAEGVNGAPTPVDNTRFGISVSNLGDIDGDGTIDLAVGAPSDEYAGLGRGVLHLLRLKQNMAPTDLNLFSSTLNGLPANLPAGTVVGRLGSVDPNLMDTFTYTLVAGMGADDNASFTVSGDSLRTNIPVDPAVKSSYTIRVRSTDQGGLSFEKAFTITVTATNTAAPVLNASGNPFAVLGVGGRQSVKMRQGVLVSEILARGAGGDPVSDADTGAQDGIAITAFDASLGTFQYTLVTNNPVESDWKNLDADGAIAEASALLLPGPARIRFVTPLVPHHAPGAAFLPLESKLATGLTFRAWDLTAGLSGGRGDTTTNGGVTAFSTATETATVYFEARLWRSFNTNAQLNIYTLEAEFQALTQNSAIVDRSTSAFTGFTVLLSAVPELSTVSLVRMYFGVQFNDDGTETDMGYRYLTTSGDEAGILENLGKPEKRPTREGAYFRELGVNGGTAVLGYIHSTQQPGTSQLTQIYRTDAFNKPTRPGGTPEGSTPTSTTRQEQGDHVYTTNTAFETAKPGTWRIEANRGFVRELTPHPTAGPPTVQTAAVSAPSPVVAAATSARRRTGVASPVSVVVEGAVSRTEGVARLVAVSRAAVAEARAVSCVDLQGDSRGNDFTSEDEPVDAPSFGLDEVFVDADLVAEFGLTG